ncbi:MAG: acetyl-CoA acetyltransferase [Alphaproteobacteria bacterium]|nr:acetyl-CoA acetyltransferase [Alphaproteobacteria bacterium]
MTDGERLVPSTPILVGVGQTTWRGAPEDPVTTKALLVKAARAALADTGCAEALGRAVDTLACVRHWVDSLPMPPGTPRLTNPPKSLAKALGLRPRRHVYTHVGGNTPQALVNHYAEHIARGAADTVLIAGAEAHRSFTALQKAGGDLSAWEEDEGEPDEVLGDPRPGATSHERAHGIGVPISTYPLFEEAYRKHRGRSRAGHRVVMGALMSRFTDVAAANPYAWFREVRTGAEIVTPTDGNRIVSTPYTKRMNAIDAVDMGAALVLTSVARARALGIPRGKWIFLHGAAEASELWHVSARVDYHSCGAIRAMAHEALAMADRRIAQIDCFDLYSCFPVAVEIAAAELALHEDDPRGLTVTGGLPYFGGPGNNYATHAIATMAERLRQKPGSFGLVTANGWYLTKHAVGIYSTAPVEGPWVRGDPSRLQSELDAREHPELVEAPEGAARVETYTVLHDRDGPRRVILVGRLGDGRRFLANTPKDRPELVERFLAEDLMGARGTVAQGEDGRNAFIPGGA